MIHVTCSSCGKEYDLPDSVAGRKARCKACNTAMVIPEAPDDLFGDTDSASADLTALYSKSDDTADVIDHSAPADDPLAFNPETSFQQSTPSRSSSAPPMKLLIGAGAGALGLIVIVAVVVIVMSGGGDSQEEQANNALALNLNTVVPSSIPSTTDPTTGGSDRHSPQEDTPSQPPTGSDTGTSDDPDSSGKPDESTDPVKPEEPEEPDESDEPEIETPLPETPVANQPAVPGLLRPTSSAYGIVLPEDLSLISQTRVAVRTAPHEDGSWLSMEVHKLTGLDRRAASAVSDDGASLLVRGRRIDVPANAELSDVVSDHFTAKRLLYPAKPGEALRRVVYVIKDGPYLISVLGRYPAGDDARLALFDEAAKSVQPIEGR